MVRKRKQESLRAAFGLRPSFLPNGAPHWPNELYEQGSSGHASCEPMGFDVAGEYLFVPYTGDSKSLGFTMGHVEVFRRDTGQRVGWLEPDADVGRIGLQDIRECLSAHRRQNGEYVVFLEEDWKAEVLMYRWRPDQRETARKQHKTILPRTRQP